MRLAVLRKRYTFHGGAEGFSHSLMTRLAAQGHEVHIYAISWSGGTTAPGIVPHRVPAITGNSFLRDLTFAVSSLMLLKRDRNSIDIIQSHDKTLFQDIYRAGDGCHIEWLRQRWRREGFPGRLSILLNPYHWLILLLERAIFVGHRYRKIIAISEMVRKNMIEHYRIDPEDVEVIYNGVDLERFSPANRERHRVILRQQYGLTGEDFVILFVGSGFERKGVATLIKAAEEVGRPLSILVVGKGRTGSYRKLVRRQRVVFCGPQKEVERYYAAADVFVFPTIYEPFGNVHLEALASGLPVITTGNSGAAEIIRNGETGFVVDDPDDFVTFAGKIQVLMNRDLLAEMGEKARRDAERFSFENHIAKMTAFYENILAQRRNERGRMLR